MAPDLPDDRIDAIETFVGDWLAEERMPGASVTVTTDEDLAYAGGFGSRDLAENDPATAETVYGVGSVTKSFTALAILQLVERGLVALDDPVADHLDVDLPGKADPTLHELLTHSSGVPSLGTSSALIARQAGIGETGLPLGDREDFYRHLASADGEVAPAGDRFMYCNTGTATRYPSAA